MIRASSPKQSRERKSILLVGSVVGANRSQTLIRYLENRTDLSTIAFTRRGDSTLIKMLRRLRVDTLFYVFTVLFRRPNVVFLLAMNSRHSLILRLSRYLGLGTVLDFYTPRSSIDSSDRKLDKKRRKDTDSNRKLSRDFERIRSADLTIFLTHHEKKLWTNQLSHGSESSGACVVPLVVPDTGFRRPPVGQLGRVYTLCWWGKMSRLHGLDYVLQELLLLERNGKDFRVQFFDNDLGRLEVFREWLSRFPNSLVARIQVNSELTMGRGLEQYLVSHCDLAIGPMGFTALGLDSVANKVVEAWALGIPIVTQRSLALPPGSEEAGLFLARRETGALAKLIEGGISMSDSGKLSEMVDTARRIYEEQFTEEKFAKAMGKALRKLD